MNSIQGWKLREFRKSKLLTIPHLSNKLNYNSTLIAMYEEGIKRPDNSF
ncbi:transcriptional regulator [Bacillus cereus]|nr:transcriptional regulator [Bacillus cereus]OPA02099.1 transcriptional regulator [Bacillus cereus]